MNRAPPPTEAETWKPYLGWNEALFQHYFSENVGQRPVYLDTDEDILDSVGAENGLGDVDDFESAVIATLGRSGDLSGLFYWHRALLAQWVTSGRKGSPLFVGLLAFFCLVASRMRQTEEYAGHNFYHPLTEALGLKPDQKEDVAREYAAIDDFWRQLNAWLLENDGACGLPTAFPLDHRVHVSIPLSQALLREQDRQALPVLFEAFGLRHGQVISRPDMQRLLKDWVPHSRLTSTVKRLWRRAEVQERVAEIACLELFSWDGVTQSSDDRRLRARLALVAHFRTSLRPSLSLTVGVSDSGTLSRGPFLLLDAAPEAAKLALEGLSGKVTLEESDVRGWLDVKDAELISIPDLLIATIELKTENSTTALTRNARSVVVFTFDETIAAYVESANVELGRNTLILVVNRLADRAGDALELIARPGFLRHDAGSVRNLPEGWTLFSGVQVVGLLESEVLDLSPLAPVSWTSLEVQGGVRLSPRTWLVMSPPELIATGHEGRPLSVSLQRDDGGLAIPSGTRGRTARESALVREPVQPTRVIELASLELEPDDYVALLEDGNKVIARATIRLRSADDPPPDMKTSWFGHAPEAGPFAAISASAAETGPVPSVTGALVTGGSKTADASSVPPADLSHELKPWVASDDLDDVPEVETQARAVAAQGCLTGAHHWVISAVTNLAGFYRPQSGYCRNCNLGRRFPARPRTIVTHEPRSSTRTSTPSLLPQSGVTRGTTARDFDILLEALCYQGSGDWSSFERLARQIDDSALFAMESLRQLVALGHIDVALSDRDMRPTEWSVAPAVLAVCKDGRTWVLCGRRSHAFVAQLERVASAAGGSLIRVAQANGPTAHFVTGLPPDRLEEVTKQVSAAGHPLTFSKDPVQEILSLLPSVSQVVATGRLMTPPTRFDVETFNPATNQWDDCSDLAAVGVYRFPTHPRVIAVNDGHGFKELEVRLAKLWAAVLTGAPAFAYSSADEELVVRAGSELPGLYGRAAVLCSGLPPVRRSDMTSVYRAMPADVASLLWEKVTT